MDIISGLPAHPLLTHIPVILLPLAVLGVVVMVIKPSWHQRYRWAVLAVASVGAIGTIFVAQAGEKLEEMIIAIEGEAASSGWEAHSQAGETARTFALLFLLTVLIFVLVPFFMERKAKAAANASPAGRPAAAGGDGVAAPRTSTVGPVWLRLALAVLVLAGATGSLITVIQAGHSGSKSVWQEVVDNSKGKVGVDGG